MVSGDRGGETTSGAGASGVGSGASSSSGAGAGGTGGAGAGGADGAGGPGVGIAAGGDHKLMSCLDVITGSAFDFNSVLRVAFIIFC